MSILLMPRRRSTCNSAVKFFVVDLFDLPDRIHIGLNFSAISRQFQLLFQQGMASGSPHLTLNSDLVFGWAESSAAS